VLLVGPRVRQILADGLERSLPHTPGLDLSSDDLVAWSVLVEGNVTVDDRRLFGRSTERPWSTVDGSILFLELVTGSNLGFLFLPLFFQNTDSLPCFLTQEMYLEHASPVT
jgi:hypothetical protein